MTEDYTQFGSLDGIYLEDSFVLAISEQENALSFKLEAVLTTDHPRYHPPLPNEQYCYADGELIFSETTSIVWLHQTTNRYTDASGEEDLGNIDSLTRSGNVYVAEGDWGEVHITTDHRPRFTQDS